MAELIEITRGLEMVKSFSPMKRVFLLAAGTLQGTLSAYFGMEVVVELERQFTRHNVERNQEEIVREVVLRAGAMNACHAESSLYIDRADVREKVMSEQIGIGQILEVLDVRARFTLLNVGQNSLRFWREYKLEGEGVTYLIKESFPQYWYQA